MTMLLLGLGVTLALNGLTMSLLERAFHAPAFAPNHFREPLKTRATDAEKLRLFALNTVLSLAILFGSAIFLYPWLFTDRPMGAGLMALQTAGILLLDDLLYYAMHRWLFHHKKFMRFVHGLHHSARTPSARESMFTHPVELVSGLTVLMLSVWAVGPVHVVAFLIANFIYSELNIVIHSGIAFPTGPMKALNFWARKHHGHHGVDVNSNFGSISPIWDVVLRTSI